MTSMRAIRLSTAGGTVKRGRSASTFMGDGAGEFG
jgi:hypothetical protein